MHGNQDMMTWDPPGGQVQLLPSKGRVLQVKIGSENAFWLPDVYLGDWNAGGDRLWLAPEADWFWKYQDDKVIGYEVPKSLDPGSWRLRFFDDRTCEWEQKAQLAHQQQDATLEVQLRRRISLVKETLHSYFSHAVAYTTDDSATIVSGIPKQSIGFWSLLQVPAGGHAYVGTQSQAPYRDYFQPIPEALCELSNQYARFELTGTRQFKVGISPDLSNGTFLYVRPVAEGYLGIVRRFFSQPWREYCDAPLGNSGGQGDAVQIYSDDGTIGAFGEIEFHGPAFPASEPGSQFGASHVTIVGTISSGQIDQWLDYWTN